jgi:large subunit ribosomal protein L17
MKHASKIKKLGRKKNVREALITSLAEALILEKKITTTEAKAKALRPFIEKLVTKAKEDTVQNRRLIASRLKGRDEAVKILFTEIAPTHKERSGGYTRILKLPMRQSDASPMAIIEFV